MTVKDWKVNGLERKFGQWAPHSPKDNSWNWLYFLLLWHFSPPITFLFRSGYRKHVYSISDSCLDWYIVPNMSHPLKCPWVLFHRLTCFLKSYCNFLLYWEQLPFRTQLGTHCFWFHQETPLRPSYMTSTHQPWAVRSLIILDCNYVFIGLSPPLSCVLHKGRDCALQIVCE